MSANLKKVLVICGQTGVGKTDIAVQIAQKLKTEIIVLDNMQQYKQINICNNKPLQYLNKQKFHNIDITDINDNSTNAATYAIRSTKIMKDLTNQGKIPILEGGSPFYVKSVITGNTEERGGKEQEEYERAVDIARAIIDYDNNFNTTLERLYKLDTSLPQFVVSPNDTYRLEKRLVDAILFGDGAYKIVKQKEEERREKSQGEFEFYNFFLYMDKMRLWATLEHRCELMVKQGLLDEVVMLLKDGYLTSKTFSQKGSIFTHAYGIEESLTLLKTLVRKYNNKDHYIQAFSPRVSPKDTTFSIYRREAERFLYNYLYEFTINNRQYAKKQAAWFKSADDIVWKAVTSTTKTQVADEILSLLTGDKQKYLDEIANSNNLKQEINRQREPKYLPHFPILKDKKFIHDFLKSAYNQIEPVKDKIAGFDLLNTSQNQSGDKQKNINIELIKKYLI
jgi:tRNA dimethylallyltransferase